MAEEQGGFEGECDIPIRSIEEAFDALRVMPEMDPNGPVLVWR